MKWLQSQPLALQFSVLLIATGLVVAVAAYMIGAAIHIGEVRNQARTVADMVDNVGTWATQYRGVWVKADQRSSVLQVGSFLEQDVFPAANGNVPGAKPAASFHRKNPALIQRELSDITSTSGSRAKFRLTSDKYMNPANRPNSFDREAIAAIRGSGLSEYSKVKEGRLLFARKVVAEKGCMTCHASPESAPVVVRAMYPGPQGYGYEVGKLAGIISVSIPMDYSVATVVSRFDRGVWIALVISALAVLSLLIFVHRALIVPIRQVHDFASRAANADLGDQLTGATFTPWEHESRNEVHQLNTSVKAMYASIHYLFSRNQR
jgi:hypothetical protein